MNAYGIYANDKCWALRCMTASNNDAKMVTGAKWNKNDLSWEYPQTAANFETLRKMFPTIYISDNAKRKYEALKQRDTAINDLKLQPWQDAKPIEPMPIKVNAFRHQVAGYNLACTILGVF